MYSVRVNENKEALKLGRKIKNYGVKLNNYLEYYAQNFKANRFQIILFVTFWNDG